MRSETRIPENPTEITSHPEMLFIDRSIRSIVRSFVLATIVDEKGHEKIIAQ